MGKLAYIRLILEAKFGDDSLFKPVELPFDALKRSIEFAFITIFTWSFLAYA